MATKQTEPQIAMVLDEPALPAQDDAWRAVEERDKSFIGRFVFAVSSTGIYCRPGCPARTPLRRNVRFFASPAAAEGAGFRACRRCRPAELAMDRADVAVTRALRFIETHVDERVTLERLGEACGMSPFHLQRVFKRSLGLTPREYMQARRAERFRDRLRRGDTVSRATYEAGYGSSSGAYTQADAHLGMTPGAYRRGAAGVTIEYTIVASALGRLLVGATARGVCAIALADDDTTLVAALREEYPHAELHNAPEGFGEWVRAIVSYLRGDNHQLDVPVDVDGTAFQTRVWKALRAIPYGKTVSYRELAEAVGLPTGARAVARACATNRVALVIPCHRVVRGDGELGGYRWGIDRKRKLLETERAAGDAKQ